MREFPYKRMREFPNPEIKRREEKVRILKTRTVPSGKPGFSKTTE